MDYRRSKSDSCKSYTGEYSKHRHRRSRSRSRSPYRKRHRSRTKSPKYKEKRPQKIDDYKQELTRFLEENANIKQTKEFWIFYEKYMNIQKLKPKDPSLDRNMLVNFDFDEHTNILWDKLPVLDRFGEKFHVSREDFEDFLLVLKIYQDFQQKSKFSKLKKLRTSQNELPIAQYRKEIINKLKDTRVMLIAGNTGKFLMFSIENRFSSNTYCF